VIQLLFKGYDVQPHYICDPKRASTHLELSAMQRIRQLLQSDPKLEGDLLPSKIIEFSNFQKYSDISEAYLEVMRECYIGVQYKWIAEYCRDRNIESIDVSVLSNPFIVKHHNSEEYPYFLIFGNLNFPLINFSKSEMRRWCVDNEFISVIEESWFCHSPTRNGKPCGVCSPCIVVVEEGMGYRLPTSAKVRYHLRVIPRLKSFLKKYPRLYAYLYKLKPK
jgi:hypothetical protein